MSKKSMFRDFDFKKFNQMTEVDDVVKTVIHLYYLRWRLLDYPEVKFMMENNNVSFQQRKEIVIKFLDCFDYDMSPHALAIIFYLMEKKLMHRLGYFINVLKYYFATEEDLMLVEVISKFFVGEDILKIYKASLEFLYNKRIEFVYKKVDSLLGGFKLRWYNGEIDLTVRRKVTRIKELIEKGR